MRIHCGMSMYGGVSGVQLKIQVWSDWNSCLSNFDSFVNVYLLNYSGMMKILLL